jgi:RNA polymerase sigma-70 factor, ECF subfamily
VTSADPAVPVSDADSAAWVQGLSGSGPERDATVARLHQMLLRVARHEARRRGAALQMAGPELDDISHQAAADALIAITGKVGQFRGDSRFTTWAYKFAVFEVATKINRHAWRKPTLSLEAEDWDRLPERFGFAPDEQSEWEQLLGALHHAVNHDLTAHQRRVFVALVLNGAPLDAVVAEAGSNRNAIYKTLFDARRKLRASLVTNGYLESDREP